MTSPQGPARRGTLILAIVAGVLVLLVVIGAILVFALGGNGKGGSTTAQTGASTSQRTSAITTSGPSTSATSATSPTTSSSSSAARVVVDGKDQNVDGTVKCNTEAGTLTINIGLNVFAELTDADPPKVNEVGLGSVEGIVLAYHGGGDGDATVTRDGKTYKITGHATGFDITHPLEGLQSKAFEIEATCP